MAALMHQSQADIEPEIKFVLGNNIHDTAKKSGAPKFSTRNVAGLISYKLIDLPADIAVHYIRAGYEIEAQPLFAFTLYADEEHKNDLAVQTAVLQLDTDAIQSHESAKIFVEDLISRFQKGKWKRHISDLCPAVAGRSSFLNEAGEPERIWFCPLDPTYRLSAEDWIRMMRMTQIYQWIGDGVLATLTVGYSDDIRGITYSVGLEFDDFSMKKRREEANLTREMAEGDEKGWNSTARQKSDILARKALVKVLEQNAHKRGDVVLTR
jgi:hypothetical protein